ncbi:unnamed protein product [Blepharisma stoltei]|uniref:Uncharacterized protein n=1 Tax=Blepharisma stoltei TaxID=1481888 RepID=A0AAU9JPL5_9CILI|nr:unnamed protein product [Blepharisma stoltei]
MLKKVWIWYANQVDIRPLTMQVFGGCLIAGIGDYISQAYLEGPNQRYNKRRAFTVTSYGGLEIAVEAILWYPFLDRFLGSHQAVITSFWKAMIDQTLYQPIEITAFMRYTWILENRKDSLKEKFERDYELAMLANFFYWVPMSFMLFLVVPLKFRAVATSFTCLVMDTFMSFAAHNNLKEAYTNLVNLFKEKLDDLDIDDWW